MSLRNRLENDRSIIPILSGIALALVALLCVTILGLWLRVTHLGDYVIIGPGIRSHVVIDHWTVKETAPASPGDRGRIEIGYDLPPSSTKFIAGFIVQRLK